MQKVHLAMLQNLSNFFSDWKMQLGILCFRHGNKATNLLYFFTILFIANKRFFSKDIKIHPYNWHTNSSTDNSDNNLSAKTKISFSWGSPLLCIYWLIVIAVCNPIAMHWRVDWGGHRCTDPKAEMRYTAIKCISLLPIAHFGAMLHCDAKLI